MGHMGGVQGRQEMKADVFIRKMQESLTLARKFLAAAQDRQQRAADRTRRAVHYETNSLVMWNAKAANVAEAQLPNSQGWVGPIRVISGTSDRHPNTIFAKLPPGFENRHPYLNVGFLKPYEAPPGAEPVEDLPRATVAVDPHTGDKDLEWTIGDILGHEQQPGNDAKETPQINRDGSKRWRYRVQWKHFPPGWATWEPLESFFPNAMRLVEIYHRRHGLGAVPYTAKGVTASKNEPRKEDASTRQPRKRKALRGHAAARDKKIAALLSS